MKPYGIAEIARALDARPETVAQWRRRGKLPTPTAELAMGPVWTAEEIEPWIDLVAKLDDVGRRTLTHT